MLLTLHAESLADQLKPDKGKPSLSLLDLPAYTRDTLDLHGLNLTTRLLVGSTRSDLERLRDAADKARCACLLLIDPDALEFAHESDTVGDAAIERTLRVMQAGQFLGCNSVAIAVDAPDNEDSFDFAIDRLKRVAERAEKSEINVLLAPRAGLTGDPERLTELIKKIGGFRIGTFPDFRDAAAREEPAGYLKKIVPYASVVCGSTLELAEADRPEPVKTAPPVVEPNAEDADQPVNTATDASTDAAIEAEDDTDALAQLLEGVLGPDDDDEDDMGPPPVHQGYDLDPLVAALLAVGFDGTLAVLYRGEQGGTLGVDLSRRALEHAINAAKG